MLYIGLSLAAFSPSRLRELVGIDNFSETSRETTLLLIVKRDALETIRVLGILEPGFDICMAFCMLHIERVWEV